MVLSNNTSIIYSQKPNTWIFLTLSWAYAKLYTILSALVDLLYLTGAAPVSAADYYIPWKCWICHVHTTQQFHLLSAHQLLSKSSSSAQGRWMAQSLEERAPEISCGLDEFLWRAVQGLFAIHSTFLTENIDWTYRTFRFPQSCFLFLFLLSCFFFS